MMFNSFINDSFGTMMDEFFGSGNRTNLMATDVKENEGGYELDIELPGCSKDNVEAELKNGYLTITARSNDNVNESEKGRYIRRERHYGSCTRSFYVGDRLTQDDIKAKFEDGVLIIAVPKEVNHPEIEDRHTIAIEG